MSEKQKPIPKIVKVAAKAMNDPASVTKAQIKSMAARILDDQKNDPQPHKPVHKSGARPAAKSPPKPPSKPKAPTKKTK